jgi:hypothetical protein
MLHGLSLSNKFKFKNIKASIYEGSCRNKWGFITFNYKTVRKLNF